MRDGGNEHESSWEAAYTYIKKQKGGIFKVSPKQAASQIIETVVREKEKYSYCVEYLDKLHPNRQIARDLKREKRRKEKEAREREKQRKELEKEFTKKINLQLWVKANKNWTNDINKLKKFGFGVDF
jgi:hypothetical protein